MVQKHSQKAFFNLREPVVVTGGPPLNRGRGLVKSQERHSGISIMSKNRVKIPRGPLVGCLTCPICTNLYREATTINVCLHTFCKDCIYQKLEEDETNSCPVCKTYLGSSPKETLRPDSNLRDLVMHIFPSENSTTREERSETSLVNEKIPKVTKPNTPGAKAVAQDSGMSQETIRKLHEDRGVAEKNNHQDKTSSLESSSYPSTASKKQVSRKMELPQVASAISEPKAHENSLNETNEGPNWKRLARHKEAANKQTEKSTLMNTPTSDTKNKGQLQKKRNIKGKARESLSGQKDDEKLERSNALEEMPIPGADGVEKFIDSGEQTIEASAENDLSNDSRRILCPVWFSLLACKDKTGHAYPQIPNCYIRVKDGDLPASYINKYLAKKLNLKHESEVEVMCCGQPLIPSLTLTSIVDMWVKSTSYAESMCLNSKAAEGNSDGKNFVMELTYRRSEKHCAPQPN